MSDIELRLTLTPRDLGLALAKCSWKQLAEVLNECATDLQDRGDMQDTTGMRVLGRELTDDGNELIARIMDGMRSL